MTKSLTKMMQSGVGKPGYCKLCSLDDPKVQDEFDKRVGIFRTEGEGEDTKRVYEYTPRKLNDWLARRVEGFQDVSRNTIYSHREHVMNPKDRLIGAVQKRQLEGGIQPQMTSEEDFLDAVIALGQQKALADPEAVSIDHALKATQIKRQSSKGGTQQVLIQLLTGRRPPDVPFIEGEAKEV